MTQNKDMKFVDIMRNAPIVFEHQTYRQLYPFKDVIAEDNTFIGDQSNLPDISFDDGHARAIGSFNQIPIWGSKCYGMDHVIVGALTPTKQVLGWCMFDEVRHPGYLTFIRTWVDPEHRNNNITLTIINFLITKYHYKIIIDKEERTSSASRGMLKKWVSLPGMMKHFDLNFYDGKNKIENPDVDTILEPHTKNDIHIVIESENPKRKYDAIFGYGKRIIGDWVWY